MSFLKAILALFLAFFTALNPFDGPNEVPHEPSKPTESYEYLEYPEEAIITLKEANLTRRQFTSRADDDGDELYINAQGYTDINGIIESPDFMAFVEKKTIPVYATTVFVGETQKGALHSFSEIYVDSSKDFSLSFQLTSTSIFIKNVKIFSQNENPDFTFGTNVVNTSITELGTYTFVFNNNEQDFAFTLFVRELVDEDKEIADLKAEYGENNVVVVEKGFHNSDPYFNFFGTNNTVYYLRRGAYLLAKHAHNINSDDDNYNNTSKTDKALYDAGQLPMGLTRCPYLNFNICNNVKLLGNGVIDLSHMDRGERRGIVIAYSNNVEIRGVKFINAPEWTFITYDSENITIKDVDIFGYRQNSDAFAICNTRNATIDNCFCRSGDDLFDVKALGGRDEAISKNITFTNCTAWNGKARCFGICGEAEKSISNVTFKDSQVIFHDATWNSDRIPALAIVVEDGSVGSINNVTFENIDIYDARSRAIGCLIYGDTVENFNISGIKYKNISYNSAKVNKIASNKKTTNKISAEFENVYANGNKITQVDNNNFEYDKYATITVK